MRLDLGPRVTLEEAAPLAHAIVASVADARGVRALAIKGPAISALGLRVPRVHADIDVLVHPDQLDAMLAALAIAGWRVGLASTAPMIMPAHSVSLLNDLWPTTIDLHHYFPGFLAPAGKVFDRFWAQRIEVVLAGTRVQTLDPANHAALAALHLLRNQRDEAGRRQLTELARRSRAVLGANGPGELLHVARQSGAVQTLRPFLREVGLQDEQIGDEESHEDLKAWELRVTSEASAPWLIHLGRTPIRHWPRTAWHALVLSDDEIRTFHGAGRGRDSNLALLRWRRIRRGLRSLPVAAAGLVRRSLGGW